MTVLRHATVVPMDGDRTNPTGDVRRASLRMSDGVIAAIGDLEPEPGEITVDAEGLLAIPGLVQGHVHYAQTLFRGLADDRPLLSWLRECIWPFEHAHDPASLRASAELSVIELLRGGTTTVQVMESVRHTEASFEVAAASGMTTVMGNCLMDRSGDGAPAGMATTAAEAMAMCEELRAAFDRRGRLHYAVSPRFILSCSPELAADAAAFAAQHDLRIHTHACEHREEVDTVRAEFGVDYLEALREQGLLGERTGLAHCVHTTDGERRALLETDSAVWHCPSANLKLGSGIAPITEYEALGLRFGLGADGAPCNNRLSGWTELRQAALLQSVRAEPGAWPAARALRAATLGGAQALGLDHEIGSLEIGKRADVVLIDPSELEPGGDPISQLVYSAHDHHVRHVFVGGEPAVEEGVVVTLDAGRVRANARDQLARLLTRAGWSR